MTGVNDSCESIGCLAGYPSRALQSQAAFLNGRPSYLLYFWEVADTHQLLQSSLQRLNNSIAASDGSFAAVSTTAPSSQRRRQRREEDDDDSPPGLEASVRPLSQSISELAECQRQVLLYQAEHGLHEQQLVQQRDECARKQQAHDRNFRRRAELSDLARKYRKLDAELDLNMDLNADTIARLSVL